MTKHEWDKKELDYWRDHVRRSVDTLSSGALYMLWSRLFGTRKRKPKKSYWQSTEADKIIQRLLGMIGDAAGQKEDNTPLNYEEITHLFSQADGEL